MLDSVKLSKLFQLGDKFLELRNSRKSTTKIIICLNSSTNSSGTGNPLCDRKLTYILPSPAYQHSIFTIMLSKFGRESKKDLLLSDVVPLGINN